ncbi:hypothetical protein QL285_085328 [Trifolium repens]|nr:hypothetical protein QL285_085328 [Trifolium repens]
MYKLSSSEERRRGGAWPCHNTPIGVLNKGPQPQFEPQQNGFQCLQNRNTTAVDATFDCDSLQYINIEQFSVLLKLQYNCG